MISDIEDHFCVSAGHLNSFFGEKNVWIDLLPIFILDFFFALSCIYFKVFIEYIAVLFLFHLLVFPPQGMWDPSFPNQG